jgi:hypothetical protein
MGKKSKGQQDDPATSPGGGKSTSPKKPGRSKKGKGKKSQAAADNTLEIEAAVGQIGHSKSPGERAYQKDIDRNASARVKVFPPAVSNNITVTSDCIGAEFRKETVNDEAVAQVGG